MEENNNPIKLKNVQTIDNFFKITSDDLSKNITYNPFYKGTLKKETRDIATYLIELNLLGFWTVDSQVYKKTVKYLKRNYLLGFFKRSLCKKLALELSQKGIFVGIIDHKKDKSYFYSDGVKENWTNENLVIKYKITNNDLGNLELISKNHVWNNGSWIYDIEDYFSNKNIENFLMDEYMHICMTSSQFINDEFFKECKNAVHKVVNNNL